MMTMMTMMTLHNNQPDDGNDEDKDDDKDNNDDKDEDDDKYNTHPTLDRSTMEMTTTLENQTVTDPMRIDWRTTIQTPMDQTTKEVCMSTDLVTIEVQITTDPATTEVWMTTDLAKFEARMTRDLATMAVFSSEKYCRCGARAGGSKFLNLLHS